MASHTGEIITIQSGHYANFVGAHWWNLQQAAFCFDPTVTAEDNCVNHDIFFREGQTLLGEFTFTPRLIAFELKQSMGTLKKEGILYDLPNRPVSIPWQEGLTVEKDEKMKQNNFLKNLAREDGLDEEDEIAKKTEPDDSENVEMDESGDKPVKKIKYDLDECVNVWSDFLKVHYHPKSMCLVESTISEDADNAVDSILVGHSVAKGSLAEEMENKFHFFTEESDHLQAFQVFLDTYDRFAGIGTNLLEMIADDYGSKSVLCFGLSPSVFKTESPVVANMHRILSSVIAYTSIHEHCSLLVPATCSTDPWSVDQSSIPLPYLDYKSDLNYHTSAILAALLDTATLPLRAKSEPVHVRDLCSSLNVGGRKVAALVGTLPLPLSRDKPLLDYLMSLDTLPWSSFSALDAKAMAVDPQLQQLVVRGATDPLIKSPDSKDLPRTLNHVANSKDLLGLYLTESMPKTKSYVRGFNPPMNTMAPFPHIFSPEVSVKGLLDTEKRNENVCVESIPTLAGLQSHPRTGQYLKSLVTEAKKINLKRMSGFFDQTFETDDFNECIEKLLTVIEDYACESEESDSDNDDA